jgi:amidase
LKRSAADIAKAENLRTAMYHRMRVFLEKYDFFVCPVQPAAAFPVDQDYPREIAGVR